MTVLLGDQEVCRVVFDRFSVFVEAFAYENTEYPFCCKRHCFFSFLSGNKLIIHGDFRSS